MPKRTKSYRDWQMQKLADPELASGYLNAALEDSQEMFLIALRKVAQAKEMAAVAKEAGVQRETLYHALSGEGNPTFSTLTAVLNAVGMQLLIVPKETVSGFGITRLLVPMGERIIPARQEPLSVTPVLQANIRYEWNLIPTSSSAAPSTPMQYLKPEGKYYAEEAIA